MVRHGECAHNTHALPSPVDGTSAGLTEVGREQARACGRWLRGLGLDVTAVCSSPSERARETAALLGLAGVVEPCLPLAERAWGRWFEGAEGDTVDERRAEARRQARADPWGWRPEGGESLREVRDRVGCWLAATLAGLRSGALVAVSHGEAIMAARTALEPSWSAHPLPLPRGAGHTVPNGAVLLYEFEADAEVPARRGLIADPLTTTDRRAVHWQQLTGAGA
ncbi:histidine phosphatase family protein [Streptomyces sp. NPDC058534]|uniref:histidine phosphatase family protein n=1 Tax=Streptomyces sp. NPDC058534 TaxID=3346541 RepID=UPI00366935CE